MATTSYEMWNSPFEKFKRLLDDGSIPKEQRRSKVMIVLTKNGFAENQTAQEERRRLEEERVHILEEQRRMIEEQRRVAELVKRQFANGGSGYSYSSSGSSGGAPGGHCGTNGAGGGSNHDGSSWSFGLRTRPGGIGTADGGSSGCSCGSSGSSGGAPGKYCGTNGAGGGSNHGGSSRPGGISTADGGSSGCLYGSSGSSGGALGKYCGTNGAGGGSEETPNGHSGSSGNSGFPGSPGLLRDTPGGTGRPDDLLAHAYFTTERDVTGKVYCKVTLEVGRRNSFDSASMVSGDGSRWEQVLLLMDDEGRPPVMEVRIMPFGREGYYWKVDPGTSIVQAIDLKSLHQGSTVSVSWKLCNTEPGRMMDLQCVVEMCQYRMNQYGAIDKTERTKFPLTLQARDFSSPNAPVGNNDDSPVYRGGIPSVGEHEHIVTHLLDIVAQHKTLQDETALRLSRLELRDTKREDEISQIRQQQEMDNRRIADLEKFKEKFSQVQPSSDD